MKISQEYRAGPNIPIAMGSWQPDWILIKIYPGPVQLLQEHRDCVAKMLKTGLEAPFHLKEK